MLEFDLFTFPIQIVHPVSLVWVTWDSLGRVQVSFSCIVALRLPVHVYMYTPDDEESPMHSSSLSSYFSTTADLFPSYDPGNCSAYTSSGVSSMQEEQSPSMKFYSSALTYGSSSDDEGQVVTPKARGELSCRRKL